MEQENESMDVESTLRGIGMVDPNVLAVLLEFAQTIQGLHSTIDINSMETTVSLFLHARKQLPDLTIETFVYTYRDCIAEMEETGELEIQSIVNLYDTVMSRLVDKQ